MREQARIQRIISLLETIWQQQPDVRFNQLISNLQHMYSAQNQGYGKRKAVEKSDSDDVETSYLDFFYLEDVKWEAFLDSIVAKAKANQEAVENNTNDNRQNEMQDNIIAVSKLILSNKTVDEIAEALALSPTYVERIKATLLKGTTLDQLQKEYTEYKRIRRL